MKSFKIIGVILVAAMALGILFLEKTAWQPSIDLLKVQPVSAKENDADLKNGTQSRVLWNDSLHQESKDLALVYMQGFTGYVGETSPLVERLSQQLSANAYFSRLSGHGFSNGKIASVEIANWLSDAEIAYAKAQQLGRQHVYIALSTGAGLAAYLALKHKDNSCFVFLSPNFGLRDHRTLLGTGDWGKSLLKLVMGSEFQMPAGSLPQSNLSSPRISLEASHAFLEMTKSFRDLPMNQLSNPALFVYAQDDVVVDTSEIHKKFQQLNSQNKKEFVLPQGGHTLIHWKNDSELQPLLSVILEFIQVHCLRPTK